MSKRIACEMLYNCKDEKYSDQKKIMLKYVIAMAQNLGLECMVEGVETAEHVNILKEFDCFYFRYKFYKMFRYCFSEAEFK